MGANPSQGAGSLIVTGVDHAPDDLCDQLPLVVHLLRQIPGDDQRLDFAKVRYVAIATVTEVADGGASPAADPG